MFTSHQQPPLFDLKKYTFKRRTNLFTWMRLRVSSFFSKKHQVADEDEIVKEIQFGNNKSSKELFDAEDIKARAHYGPLVVRGYLTLIIILATIPLTLWAIASWGNPYIFKSGLSELEDFVVAISAGLSGLGSLAGFVIGRYFKERA